jgi:hypothetical protein
LFALFQLLKDKHNQLLAQIKDGKVSVNLVASSSSPSSVPSSSSSSSSNKGNNKSAQQPQQQQQNSSNNNSSSNANLHAIDEPSSTDFSSFDLNMKQQKELSDLRVANKILEERLQQALANGGGGSGGDNANFGSFLLSFYSVFPLLISSSPSRSLECGSDLALQVRGVQPALYRGGKRTARSHQEIR